LSTLIDGVSITQPWVEQVALCGQEEIRAISPYPQKNFLKSVEKRLTNSTEYDIIYIQG
jgi:hypothetical protein